MIEQKFSTIVITLNLFKVVKYYWKPQIRGQRVFYSCYHQTQLKTIQHPSSPELSFSFIWFLFSVLPNFREHIFLARTSISALFLKHHSTYLQDNENIELCDVARAFVQISGNGPRSKKFGYPCGRPTWRSTILTKMSYLINGHEHLSVHSPEDLATYRENEHRQLR